MDGQFKKPCAKRGKIYFDLKNTRPTVCPKSLVHYGRHIKMTCWTYSKCLYKVDYNSICAKTEQRTTKIFTKVPRA